MMKRTGISILLFAAAIALLGFSGIGGARAVLVRTSQTYTAQMDVKDIGVTILENGDSIAGQEKGTTDGTRATGTIFSDLEKASPGKKYDETIAVQNSGSIDAYMRLTVRKYWLDADGNRDYNLSPALIRMNMTDSTNWIEDTDSHTTERQVFYYKNVVSAGGETDALFDGFIIDQSIASKVTQTPVTDENGFTTITTTYDYDGYQFCIELTADAVQTHNGADAIYSAWGTDVNISEEGGSLGL